MFICIPSNKGIAFFRVSILSKAVILIVRGCPIIHISRIFSISIIIYSVCIRCPLGCLCIITTYQPACIGHPFCSFIQPSFQGITSSWYRWKRKIISIRKIPCYICTISTISVVINATAWLFQIQIYRTPVISFPSISVSRGHSDQSSTDMDIYWFPMFLGIMIGIFPKSIISSAIKRYILARIWKYWFIHRYPFPGSMLFMGR